MNDNRSDYRHEAAPSQTQLVLRRHPESGELVETHLRWGFIPHSSLTRPAIQPIHVRAETIAEKPMFAEAYRKRRCVVPMNSFYEKDSQGRRHVISRRDGALFGAAGIWDNWFNTATNQWERTFAIITVDANELITPIHDRMLAILHMSEVQRWLSNDEDPGELLRPYPSDSMIAELAKAGKQRKRRGSDGPSRLL